MASLKDIQSRIASIRSTMKITGSMKMVASAKLHRAQGSVEHMQAYQQQLEHIMGLLSDENVFCSPYLEKRPLTRVAVVPFSSNTSLCGTFNADVCRELENTVNEYRKLMPAENILIFPVGKKVMEYAGKQHSWKVQGDGREEMAEKTTYSEAVRLTEELKTRFLHKEIDRVELIYHQFVSVGKQNLIHKLFLPFEMPKSAVSAINRMDYIIEPDSRELFEMLQLRFLTLNMYVALMNSNVSEHAARMLSMQTANDNANDLIGNLTVQYNKSRQQAITNELLDMMGVSM